MDVCVCVCVKENDLVSIVFASDQVQSSCVLNIICTLFMHCFDEKVFNAISREKKNSE